MKGLSMVAHRSGVVQGDGLGHQFAYDERQIGDDGYYGNHGESLGIGGYSRNEANSGSTSSAMVAPP